MIRPSCQPETARPDVGGGSSAQPARRGWKHFVAGERDKIKQIRKEIQNLATETGLEIAEFRRIVHMVQKGEREARIAHLDGMPMLLR